MKFILGCLLLTVAGCSRPDSQAERAALDSMLSSPGVATAIDTVMAVMTEYEEDRLSADAAASVLVDVSERQEGGLNIELPTPLRRAVISEIERRRKERDSVGGQSRL